MKILFINRLIGISWGGGENYDFNLATALQSLGHQVTFLAGQTASSKPMENVGSVPAIPVVTPYLRKYMYQLAGKVRFLPGLFAEADLHWFSKAAIRKVEQLALRPGFDVIQVLGIPSLTNALRAHGWPVAMRFPGPPAWFQSRLLQRLSSDERVAMFSHGDTVHYFERRLGIRIPELLPGVLGDVYRPVESLAAKMGIRQNLAIDPDAFVLVTVGRLIEGKGHDFLLSAFAAAAARHPQLRLAVVGDGPLRNRLANKARALGVGASVRFTGHLEREEVARQLRASDVFCLLSDYENYSNAVIEAMAAGLPVIATRIGGFPLQIDDGVNGFLVAPGSVPEFLEKLERIISSNSVDRRLSAGARAFASRFSWETTAIRATEVYEQILAV